MSETEAAISYLRRERFYLGKWRNSVENMLSGAPRNSKEHGELMAEKRSLEKEINRVTRRLRYFK